MPKKKLPDSKEKYRTVEFQTTISVDKKTTFNFIPTQDGCVKMIDENGNEHTLNPVEITEQYEKNNGAEKIVSKSVINENKINFDIDTNLLGYDYILAIDTNYKIINNQKMASTGYVLIKTSLLITEGNEISGFIDIKAFGWDATGINKPENFMYSNMIKDLQNHIAKEDNPLKIAIIIDSDLDNIPSFNKKTLPIFEEHILPQNFYVFYASSERGNCLQNQLLKACDKEANKTLETLAKNE